MKNKLFLTESEKQRISGLHRRAIANESKNALNEADLTQIQQLLIDKKLMSPNLASGKTSADGRLGPLTLDAIYSALTQTQNVVGDQGTSGATVSTGATGSTVSTGNTAGDQVNNKISKEAMSSVRNPSKEIFTNMVMNGINELRIGQIQTDLSNF